MLLRPQRGWDQWFCDGSIKASILNRINMGVGCVSKVTWRHLWTTKGKTNISKLYRFRVIFLHFWSGSKNHEIAFFVSKKIGLKLAFSHFLMTINWHLCSDKKNWENSRLEIVFFFSQIMLKLQQTRTVKISLLNYFV